MSDLLLIFAPDKKTFAGHLADAARSAGYVVTPHEVAAEGGSSIPELTRPATAALLVWSRPLASSATLDGWLGAIRQRPNVIEISADGIAPQGGDESRVVLLSGWRGQPYHLGWQRILAELKARCGTRKPVAAPPPPARPAPGQASAAAADRLAAGAPGRMRKPVAAAVVAALLLAGAGAFVWGGRKSAAPVAAPVAVHSADRAETPASAVPAAPPAPAPSEAMPPSSGETPVRGPATGQALAAGVPRLSSAANRPAHRAAPSTVKRYSARNSRTMRLFCARNGRSTPQCRIFLHSTGAAR